MDPVHFISIFPIFPSLYASGWVWFCRLYTVPGNQDRVRPLPVAAVFGENRESSEVRSVTRSRHFFRSPKPAEHQGINLSPLCHGSAASVWCRHQWYDITVVSITHCTSPVRPPLLDTIKKTCESDDFLNVWWEMHIRCRQNARQSHWHVFRYMTSKYEIQQLAQFSTIGDNATSIVNVTHADEHMVHVFWGGLFALFLDGRNAESWVNEPKWMNCGFFP